MLLLNALCSACLIIVAFSQQAVDHDKYNDGGKAASAQFLCAPCGDDPSEKIIHVVGFAILTPQRFKKFAL